MELSNKQSKMKKLLLLLLFIPLVSCQGVEVRKTYYDSGALASTANYVDGVKKGVIKTYAKKEELIEDSKNKDKQYYDSGGLKYEGNKQQGEWKSFYESGKLKRTGNYVTSRKQGEWKEYYESGELKSTVDYNYGRVSDIKAYNETGELIVFDRKKLIKTFHDNGQLKMEGVYADIDSLEFLLGKVIWQGNGGYYVGVTFEGGYFDDEKKMQITGIEAYRKVTEKPIKDDKWTYYYESGKIEKEESYNVNFLNKVINYSEKGFKTSEIGYGLKEGWLLADETKYYENGRTKSVYSEGYEGSYSAKYYENGQMELEDWGDGAIKTYYENGTIKSEDYDDYEGSYSAKYYENGQIELEDWGEGEIKTYYKNGQIKTITITDQGFTLNYKLIEEYSEIGKLTKEEIYLSSQLQKQFKDGISINGKVIFEKDYQLNPSKDVRERSYVPLVSFGQIKEGSTNKFVGTYSFGNNECENGCGSLLIHPESDNSLIFYLEVNRGAPSYNSGSLMGKLFISNQNTYEYTSNEFGSCGLTFKLDDDFISIKTIDDRYNCGFGNAVSADGVYKLLNNYIPEYYITREGSKFFF